ncbi:MAG: hypothetical protein ACPHXR_07980 [Flavicella sp.]
MKTATVHELKKALSLASRDEILNYCLQLSKFKKENKELLTYILFESSDETSYVDKVSESISFMFSEMNTDSFFYMKKTIRKILRMVKKQIRYSKKKTTEVELLLKFCSEMKTLRPSIHQNSVLDNMYARELNSIQKKVALLHEDLQYEYQLEIEALQKL